MRAHACLCVAARFCVFAERRRRRQPVRLQRRVLPGLDGGVSMGHGVVNDGDGTRFQVPSFSFGSAGGSIFVAWHAATLSAAVPKWPPKQGFFVPSSYSAGVCETLEETGGCTSVTGVGSNETQQRPRLSFPPRLGLSHWRLLPCWNQANRAGAVLL